ncbi:MAG: glucose-1-phosphate adenylyltransferase subunit GlgD [Oscillospiraceae bacterium]|jgi:glucose-1-phosphate adenylyltransferase|nr:glucose-1-phosphate adenylyltransferase subunit GlgD [Oscillospiraceae bacterium]
MNDMHGLIFAYAKGGENLKELTERRAVPSLPFGGRYRVIDFMLSNMVNAGVTDVGVVMRENYQSLLDHLESGKNWDLSRKRGGLRLLPPFSYAGSGPYEGVFLGNMAALYNISSYLSHIRQDYVVVAEGGLVANLPLEDALRRHVDTGADITVLCTPQRLGQQEFSSFLTLGGTGRISDLARGRDMDGALEMLGVYILSKPLLLSLVSHCAAHNLYDFERDVLQNMLGSLGLYGYVFEGYAARMTTVAAYFKHNMDMLRADARASLFLKDRPIKTKVRDEASAYYGPDARVQNCIVADGCYIEGDVENSILSRGVRIEPGVRVHNSVLLQDTRVSSGAILGYAITDKEVVIGPGRMLMGHATYPIAVSKGSVV